MRFIAATRTGFLLVLLFGAGGMITHHFYQPFQGHSAEILKDSGETEPVVNVTVIPLKNEQITQEVRAYGSVEAKVGETDVISVPFECQILRLGVVLGQAVQKDSPLLEIEGSPDALLQLAQARAEVRSSSKHLALVQERGKMKLATQQEILSGEALYTDALLRLESLERRRIDQKQLLCAPKSGVVSKIGVQQGEIVSAGAPLLGIVEEGSIVVRMGVDPSDARDLRPNQLVILEPMGENGRKVEGRIQIISRVLDPETRLVNVLVSPQLEARLTINEYVCGRIQVSTREGLVAPSESILPEKSGHFLFTIENGRAVKHTVRLGAEMADRTEISEPDLGPGLPVVVVGNSQLQDGMAIQVNPSQ